MEKRLAAEFREQTLISYEFAKVFPAVAPSLPPAWRGKLGGGVGRCRRNRKVSAEPLHTYKRRVLHGVSLVGTIVKEAVAVFDRVPQAWDNDIVSIVIFL